MPYYSVGVITISSPTYHPINVPSISFGKALPSTLMLLSPILAFSNNLTNKLSGVAPLISKLPVFNNNLDPPKVSVTAN